LDADLKKKIAALAEMTLQIQASIQNGSSADDLLDKADKLSEEILRACHKLILNRQEGETLVCFGLESSQVQIWYSGVRNPRVLSAPLSIEDLLSKRPSLIWLAKSWDLVLLWEHMGIVQLLNACRPKLGLTAFISTLSRLANSSLTIVSLIWKDSRGYLASV